MTHWISRLARRLADHYYLPMDPISYERHADARRMRSERRAMDEVWFVASDEDTRLDRLIARHVEFGKSAAQALAWVTEVDGRNAARVSATAGAADRVIVNGASGWAITA